MFRHLNYSKCPVCSKLALLISCNCQRESARMLQEVADSYDRFESSRLSRLNDRWQCLMILLAHVCPLPRSCKPDNHSLSSSSLRLNAWAFFNFRPLGNSKIRMFLCHTARTLASHPWRIRTFLTSGLWRFPSNDFSLFSIKKRRPNAIHSWAMATTRELLCPARLTKFWLQICFDANFSQVDQTNEPVVELVRNPKQLVSTRNFRAWVHSRPISLHCDLQRPASLRHCNTLFQCP